MNKIADVVLVILGIISIIGSIFLIYGISLFDNALNQVLSFDPATAANLGLDFTSAQQLGEQAKGIVAVGYLWTAIVIIGSLALIYFAVADMRRQRSIVVRKK